MRAIVYVNNNIERTFHCYGNTLDSDVWNTLNGFLDGLKEKYIADDFREIPVPVDVREKINRYQVHCMIKFYPLEMFTESVFLSVKFVND